MNVIIQYALAFLALTIAVIYLFKTFDQKICVGSDHPEFSLKETRDRLELLSHDIAFNKKENFFYKNLASFLNVQK